MLNRPVHSVLRELPRESIDGGMLTRTAIRGDGCLITMNWLKPFHDEQPPHSHPFDQTAFVLEGAMEFDVGDERFLVKAGEVLQIPAGVPHTARVVGEAVAFNVDVFAPARSDYLYLTEHQADAFAD
jgi:mannose-6-phosphate isomerase-like protein (cupin superfamily)